MTIYRNTIYFMFLIGWLSFFLMISLEWSLFIDFSIATHRDFFINFLIGIFSSCLLTVIISYIQYFVERQKIYIELKIIYFEMLRSIYCIYKFAETKDNCLDKELSDLEWHGKQAAEIFRSYAPFIKINKQIKPYIIFIKSCEFLNRNAKNYSITQVNANILGEDLELSQFDDFSKLFIKLEAERERGAVLNKIQGIKNTFDNISKRQKNQD